MFGAAHGRVPVVVEKVLQVIVEKRAMMLRVAEQ